MRTDCSQDSFDFGTVEGHRVVGGFDGGQITSHAGGLLLGASNRAIRLIERLARCFKDGRDPDALLHTVPALVGQRIFAIALGYEDINDHDHLRHDPVLQVLAGKLTGKRSGCAALAGKSTLNRLEHAAKVGSDPYHKISYDEAAIAALFVTLCLESYTEHPARMIIDLDATHDPIHGEQEGRHFHGYYDCYCYLPLYIFCGRHLLAAKLRTADKDAADGAKEEIARIVAQIRARWPDVEIILRADSGFARDDLMSWCEDNGVDYIFGLARNERLVKAIRRQLAQARRESRRTKHAARRFKILEGWETRDSWSLPRRVIAKAEWTQDQANPRFLVTSLTWTDDARYLYEDLYCARGDMENRIKECQTDMFADRTSAASMRANQLRLWFAAFAYVLICALRRIGLGGTAMAVATCGTIRLKLLKIGALVVTSVRRIKIAMASSCPYQSIFAHAHERLSVAAR
jgi:Transposase DDE domain group 1